MNKTFNLKLGKNLKYGGRLLKNCKFDQHTAKQSNFEYSALAVTSWMAQVFWGAPIQGSNN